MNTKTRLFHLALVALALSVFQPSLSNAQPSDGRGCLCSCNPIPEGTEEFPGCVPDARFCRCEEARQMPYCPVTNQCNYSVGPIQLRERPFQQGDLGIAIQFVEAEGTPAGTCPVSGITFAPRRSWTDAIVFDLERLREGYQCNLSFALMNSRGLVGREIYNGLSVTCNNVGSANALRCRNPGTIEAAHNASVVGQPTTIQFGRPFEIVGGVGAGGIELTFRFRDYFGATDSVMKVEHLTGRPEVGGCTNPTDASGPHPVVNTSLMIGIRQNSRDSAPSCIMRFRADGFVPSFPPRIIRK